MIKLTAGYIGDYPADYLGSHINFPDYHGRPVSGTLEAAQRVNSGAVAHITIDGRQHGIFADTIVEVGN